MLQSKTLLIEQLDKKIKAFQLSAKVIPPALGWVKSIRTTLGISLKQLSKKMNITKQSLQEIEMRENKGSVTLKTLKEVAQALDMQLVYGFVPKDGSLETLIERKAKELALKIVSRTEHSMKLENQTVDANRIKKALQERIELIKKEMPKTLWD